MSETERLNARVPSHHGMMSAMVHNAQGQPACKASSLSLTPNLPQEMELLKRDGRQQLPLQLLNKGNTSKD